MELEIKQIRDQQKETWNKFSPGWKKWNDLTMDFLKPMGDEIIKLLSLKNDAIVLDVAAGTGEPGLTIASHLNTGKVFSADLAEGMLEVAQENAKTRGIKNFETMVCDVSELPFGDNTFDAVSCRFGFMFFPDMELAIKEITRVLKPGGKIATAVWNIPEKNFWITATMETISKNIEITPPPPGAPGMFRCAKEGFMTDLFLKAGLKNVSAQESNGKLNCKTTAVYWNMMNEVAAPVVASLSKADDTLREKIKNDVSALINQKYPEGTVALDSSALIIYGEK